MPAKKSNTEVNDTTTPDPGDGSNMSTTETKDTRPLRQDSENGRPWPVIRSYYNPSTNSVMDVLEVTKMIAQRNGKPPIPVIIQKHVRCRDEELQEKYSKSTGVVDVAQIEVK